MSQRKKIEQGENQRLMCELQGIFISRMLENMGL